MNTKLKSVLLVDDDNSCNFLHRRLLRKSERVEQIAIANDGLEALEYIKECPNSEQACPEVIFLDINMPRMNGWEFLEAYKNLPPEQKKSIVLIMLTSSLNPDDKKRADQYEEVAGLHYKLLNKSKLEEIFKTYFPNRTGE